MKMISFLGLGNYRPATYVWGEREYQTDLFVEALVEWLQPTELLVLLTPEAGGHPNWKALQARLGGRTLLRPVPIPTGKSEGELPPRMLVSGSGCNSLDDLRLVVAP